MFLNTILTTIGVKAQIDLNALNPKYIFVYDVRLKKYFKISDILNDFNSGKITKVETNEDQVIVIVPHDFSTDQPRNVAEAPGN